jgi:hypothetical protein
MIRCQAGAHLRPAKKSLAAHLRYAIGEPFPSTGPLLVYGWIDA